MLGGTIHTLRGDVSPRGSPVTRLAPAYGLAIENANIMDDLFPTEVSN